MRKLLFQIGLNTGAQVFGRFFNAFLGLITVGVLTRYLGKAGFGEYNLILTYFSFFGILADLGLQLTMVRELSKGRLSEKVYGTFFWLKVILVLISGLLACLLIFIFPYSLNIKYGVLIACFGISLGLFNNFGVVILQSKLRLDLIAYIDILTKTVSGILIILFSYFNLGFYSILLTLFLGNFVGLALTFYYLKRFIVFNFIFDKNLAGKLISQSLPVCFLSLITLLNFKVDTILLSLFKNTQDVGVYSLSNRIIENILVLWGFYIASIYPLMANFVQKSFMKVKKILFNSSVVALLFSILFIVICQIFPKQIINILGGESFNESIYILKILSFSIPLFFINNLFFHFFLVQNKVKQIVKVMIFILLINLILNLIFIPKYSYIASSYNVIITEALLFIIYFWYTIRISYGKK